MSLRVPHSSAATSFTCAPFQSKSIFVTEGAETDFLKDFLVVYSNGATWACQIEKNVMYNDKLTFTGETKGTEQNQDTDSPSEDPVIQKLVISVRRKYFSNALFDTLDATNVYPICPAHAVDRSYGVIHECGRTTRTNSNAAWRF